MKKITVQEYIDAPVGSFVAACYGTKVTVVAVKGVKKNPLMAKLAVKYIRWFAKRPNASFYSFDGIREVPRSELDVPINIITSRPTYNGVFLWALNKEKTLFKVVRESEARRSDKPVYATYEVGARICTLDYYGTLFTIARHFKGHWDEHTKWYHTPNENMNGFTPQDYNCRGRYEDLLENLPEL